LNATSEYCIYVVSYKYYKTNVSRCKDENCRSVSFTFKLFERLIKDIIVKYYLVN